MPYLHEFIALTIIHLLAVMSPGPDFAIILRQSISFGRKTAIVTSLGIGSGIAVHVLYTLLGIGLLISQSPHLMTTAKLVGAAYIIYLGSNLLRSKANTQTDIKLSVDHNPKHQRKAFMIGFMTNVFNPKVTLFFLAIFTTVVSTNTPILIQSFYGLWIIATTIAWFSLVSFLFSKQTIRKKFLSHGYWFERLMGVVLLIFAIKLLLELI